MDQSYATVIVESWGRKGKRVTAHDVKVKHAFQNQSLSYLHINIK